MNTASNPIIAAHCSAAGIISDRQDGSFDVERFQPAGLQPEAPEPHHKLATRLGFLSPGAVFIEFADGSFDVTIQRKELPPRQAYPNGRYTGTKHMAAPCPRGWEAV